MPTTRTKRPQRPVAPAFRITKASALNIQSQHNQKKLDTIVSIVSKQQNPEKRVEVESPKEAPNSKKRSREDCDADNEETTRRRKTCKQSSANLTRPASPKSVKSTSETLEQLTSLHASFTQALAVHYAHHGMRDSVSLSLLMPAMTRLWKKRTVNERDVERMLAVWELNSSTQPGDKIDHQKSPFKLTVTGVGATRQTMLENVTHNQSSTFVESELQGSYESAIDKITSLAKHNSTVSILISGPISRFPQIKSQVGLQTQARQDKINTVRQTILSKPQQTEPDFSKLNITDPSETISQTREEKLKSRTLGLFDRLKAKQLATSSTSAKQSPADMVRRRALHRIPDLLDMLRLKQSQKLNTLLRFDLHGEPTTSRTAMMKVSFSLEQLVQEITDSSRTPIAMDEVREALTILGRDIPDAWCSVFLGEGLKCVTLQGQGWSKDEVKGWCQAELKKAQT